MVLFHWRAATSRIHDDTWEKCTCVLKICKILNNLWDHRSIIECLLQTAHHRYHQLAIYHKDVIPWIMQFLCTPSYLNGGNHTEITTKYFGGYNCSRLQHLVRWLNAFSRKYLVFPFVLELSSEIVFQRSIPNIPRFEFSEKRMHIMNKYWPFL